ncbi:sh3 domain-containing protein [Anaeramoeba flamelloides]|uniref:Sh3 domain-containing protein n=1 Tax=Anaeramoeba flamelloides TaxID=1746091 RepID=A0AAV7YNN6_9EUKA|nr:sh3 domain-containing protein [Anaeramoeba flamelloides]
MSIDPNTILNQYVFDKKFQGFGEPLQNHINNLKRFLISPEKKQTNKVIAILENLTFYRLTNDHFPYLLQTIQVFEENKIFLLATQLISRIPNISTANSKELANFLIPKLLTTNTSLKSLILSTLNKTLPKEVYDAKLFKQVTEGIKFDAKHNLGTKQKKTSFRNNIYFQSDCIKIYQSRSPKDESILPYLIQNVVSPDEFACRKSLEMLLHFARHKPNSVAKSLAKILPPPNIFNNYNPKSRKNPNSNFEKSKFQYIQLPNIISRIIFSRLLASLLQFEEEIIGKGIYIQLENCLAYLIFDRCDLIFFQCIIDLCSMNNSWVKLNTKKLPIDSTHMPLSEIIIKKLYQYLSNFHEENSAEINQQKSNINRNSNIANQPSLTIKNQNKNENDNNQKNKKKNQNNINNTKNDKKNNNSQLDPKNSGIEIHESTKFARSEFFTALRSLNHFAKSYSKYIGEFGTESKFNVFPSLKKTCTLLVRILKLELDKQYHLNVYRSLFWLVHDNGESKKHLSYLAKTYLKDIKKSQYFTKYDLEFIFNSIQKKSSVCSSFTPVCLIFLGYTLRNIPKLIPQDLVFQIWHSTKDQVQNNPMAGKLLIKHLFTILDYNQIKIDSFKKNAIWFLGEYINILSMNDNDKEDDKKKEKEKESQNDQQSNENNIIDFMNVDNSNNSKNGNQTLHDIPTDLTLKSMIIRIQYMAFFGSWNIKTSAVTALTKIAIRKNDSMVDHIFKFITDLTNNIKQIQLVAEPYLDVLWKICEGKKKFNKVFDAVEYNQKINNSILELLFKNHLETLNSINSVCKVNKNFLPYGNTSKKSITLCKQLFGENGENLPKKKIIEKKMEIKKNEVKEGELLF